MFKSFQTRLLAVFAIIFIAVTALIAVVVGTLTEGYARKEIASNLSATAEVFTHVFAERIQRLTEGADLLSSDYGFKNAVATGDSPTIRSALYSLKDRINADYAVLLSPYTPYSVVAGTGAIEQCCTIVFEGLIRKIEESAARPYTIHDVEKHLAIIAAAPLLSPDQMGWITLAFSITDSTARDFKTLSDADVCFLLTTPSGKCIPAASSLDPKSTAVVADSLAAHLDSDKTWLITLDGERYVASRLSLKNSNQTQVVLLRSLDDSLKSLRNLNSILAGVALLGILLFVVASRIVSSNITAPVRALASAAEKLGFGDLTQRVHLNRSDELGKLGESFNLMADGIAAARKDLEEAADGLRSVNRHVPEIFLQQDRSALLETASSVLRERPSFLEARLAWIYKTAPDDEIETPLVSEPATPSPKLPTHTQKIALDLNGDNWGALEIASPLPPAPVDQELLKLWCYEVAAALASIAQAEALARGERLKAVGMAVSSFVHDIRSPLTAVGLGVELMLMGGMPEKAVKDAGGKIQKSLKEINLMAEDLLGFTRGKMTVSSERVNLATLARELFAHFSQLHRSGAPMTLTIESEECSIKVDTLKIRRISHNLVKNAQQALRDFKDRPPALEIVVRRNGNQAEYSIRDNGPGLPNEIRRRLFQPFTSFGKVGGTGLGLSMAKVMAESMGGTIAVTTAPDKGTTITLSFPLDIS